MVKSILKNTGGSLMSETIFSGWRKIQRIADKLILTINRIPM